MREEREESMKTIGVTEARRNFSRLLDRIAEGEQIIIERRGVPVAILRRADPAPKMTVKEAIAAIRELRAGHRLGRLSLRRMIDAGRQ
jgi:antitoxin (DNA-binding transcriptional repressor) of toxin-antitoxin stability system